MTSLSKVVKLNSMFVFILSGKIFITTIIIVVPISWAYSFAAVTLKQFKPAKKQNLGLNRSPSGAIDVVVVLDFTHKTINYKKIPQTRKVLDGMLGGIEI